MINITGKNTIPKAFGNKKIKKVLEGVEVIWESLKLVRTISTFAGNGQFKPFIPLEVGKTYKFEFIDAKLLNYDKPKLILENYQNYKEIEIEIENIVEWTATFVPNSFRTQGLQDGYSVLIREYE